jgi:glycosyltransferase involved in cell wall biosynthesis
VANPHAQGGQTSPGFGAIVLAAYKPDRSLFRIQLESIARQTHGDFLCLVTADGGLGEVEELVREIVPGDTRFKVIGFDERLGFYRNFERGLTFVPETAEWVALSDQDDYWYEDKLSKLLPHLADHVLVSGQARVVSDDGEVLEAWTGRTNASFLNLFVQNQFTGGLLVFRRSLLDNALPFPRMDSPSELHDHWLAVCAYALGSVRIVDELVQDYIQHGNNVVGEAVKGLHPIQSYRRARELARRYEGSPTVASILRLTNSLSFGWRRVMADALAQRLPSSNARVFQATTAFGKRHAWGPLWHVFASGLRNGTISVPVALTYAVGGLVEVLRRG